MDFKEAFEQYLRLTTSKLEPIKVPDEVNEYFRKQQQIQMEQSFIGVIGQVLLSSLIGSWLNLLDRDIRKRAAAPQADRLCDGMLAEAARLAERLPSVAKG